LFTRSSECRMIHGEDWRHVLTTSRFRLAFSVMHVVYFFVVVAMRGRACLLQLGGQSPLTGSRGVIRQTHTSGRCTTLFHRPKSQHLHLHLTLKIPPRLPSLLTPSAFPLSLGPRLDTPILPTPATSSSNPKSLQTSSLP